MMWYACRHLTVRSVVVLAVVIAVASGFPCIATAEKRVALVIANGAYANTTVLPNPVNDGRAVAAQLRALSFDVVEAFDVSSAGMADTLRDFTDRLLGAEVALFFYAGHGLQVDGQNYALPVNARLESEIDLQFEALPVNVVLRQMEAEPRVSLVFLDACRDNPLARRLARSMGRTRSSAVEPGLAPVRAGDGTLITYATDPGDVALDGSGQHSPFTEALLAHMATPSMVVEQMLNRVKRDVRETTNGRQRPWVHSSLAQDFFLNPAEASPARPRAESAVNGEFLFWESINDSRSMRDYQAYLMQYPEGTFAALARNRLRELTQEQLSSQGSQDGPAVGDTARPTGGSSATAETSTIAKLQPSAVAEPPHSDPPPDVADSLAVKGGSGPVRRGVAKASVDVVATPDPYSRRIAQLESGDVVTVIGSTKDALWYMVRTQEGSGYVYKPLMRTTD